MLSICDHRRHAARRPVLFRRRHKDRTNFIIQKTIRRVGTVASRTRLADRSKMRIFSVLPHHRGSMRELPDTVTRMRFRLSNSSECVMLYRQSGGSRWTASSSSMTIAIRPRRWQSGSNNWAARCYVARDGDRGHRDRPPSATALMCCSISGCPVWTGIKSPRDFARNLPNRRSSSPSQATARRQTAGTHWKRGATTTF